jgi:hypothetical protein
LFKKAVTINYILDPEIYCRSLLLASANTVRPLGVRLLAASRNTPTAKTASPNTRPNPVTSITRPVNAVIAPKRLLRFRRRVDFILDARLRTIMDTGILLRDTQSMGRTAHSDWNTLLELQLDRSTGVQIRWC